ncbi:C39 family peptidase [filamentous cyanobacterium LEGE 11480]|uniref:C39 family peptidase n=1 Tax=Romeriopsis navalis LEGE 11480 TaxID=2777977 RepID=A0A928Z7D6_9CYAN|nr:C39 family peptidase [Romeriopsis navalis]MBE9033080.1 C39 family peptidase [Romeriopsis navalis LEGE 11480]
MKLKVIRSTVFKQYARDSRHLKPQEKVTVPVGREYEIHSWKPVGKYHMKVALFGQFLGSPPRNTWYVFKPHIRLTNSQGKPPTPPPPPASRLKSGLPASKMLNVPYKSQMDNWLNPSGACNVTCFAMVMSYFKVRRWGTGQLEDELYRYMERKGLSRHEPGTLAQMSRHYGLRNNLTLRGSLYDIRKAIAEGRPCIIHGYFTSFGHIVVIRGYNKNGFYVNDPFGEWTRYGYRKGVNGSRLFYSNELIQSKCSPEGKNYMWLHRLSRA